MSLTDMDEKGCTREVTVLDHLTDFNRTWNLIPPDERAAIEAEINRRLSELLSSPHPQWGSIMNTSIEGGKENPHTGERGDWWGTVFHPIYVACGYSESLAGMFYGNVWKKVIIARDEMWFGVRSDATHPTFPQKGIVLAGKSYFPAR
ncbi:MAG TPA: hypothetical protein VGM84_09115 [Steroidobacteraceae bacterium]|jgi:hypothetical protein